MSTSLLYNTQHIVGFQHRSYKYEQRSVIQRICRKTFSCDKCSSNKVSTFPAGTRRIHCGNIGRKLFFIELGKLETSKAIDILSDLIEQVETIPAEGGILGFLGTAETRNYTYVTKDVADAIKKDKATGAAEMGEAPAAKAVGSSPAQIVKSVLFTIPGSHVLAITSGTRMSMGLSTSSSI